MNAALLMILLAVAAGMLFAFVGLFLFACRLAKLPRPSYVTAAGVVIASSLILAMVELILIAALQKIYAFAGFPPWEVWLVGIFVGLPVSLAACTILHMMLMRVTLSQAIHVWFIERSIRYGFALGGLGIFALFLLLKK